MHRLTQFVRSPVVGCACGRGGWHYAPCRVTQGARVRPGCPEPRLLRWRCAGRRQRPGERAFGRLVAAVQARTDAGIARPGDARLTAVNTWVALHGIIPCAPSERPAIHGRPWRRRSTPPWSAKPGSTTQHNDRSAPPGVMVVALPSCRRPRGFRTAIPSPGFGTVRCWAHRVEAIRGPFPGPVSGSGGWRVGRA